MEWAFEEVFALPGEVRSYFWANWPAMLPFEASLAGRLWQLEGSHAVGLIITPLFTQQSKSHSHSCANSFYPPAKEWGLLSPGQDKKRTIPPTHLKQSKPSIDLQPRQYSYFSKGRLLPFGSPLRNLFPNTPLGLEVILDLPAGTQPLG